MDRKSMKVSGHVDGCPDEQPAGQSAGYCDIFCENCHDWFKEPHILPNGTDIAWPARWSRKQADDWRAGHGLSRPDDVPAAGPHDRPELTNETNIAGMGMLPETGIGDQQTTPAPTG